jgi:signal transduction histidine kinase
LAISHEFCQMMGGYLRAESELGKGSVFTVRLPAESSVPSVPLAGGIAERQPMHA